MQGAAKVQGAEGLGPQGVARVQGIQEPSVKVLRTTIPGEGLVPVRLAKVARGIPPWPHPDLQEQRIGFFRYVVSIESQRMSWRQVSGGMRSQRPPLRSYPMPRFRVIRLQHAPRP